MKLKPFELERYFSKYEFKVKHLLSCSDCEPYALSDLLKCANDEAIYLWQNLKLSYTESQGNPLLLDEIAKLYKGIDKSNILHIIPEEGIYIAMRSLISKGDHIVSMHPCYQSLDEIALSQGAVVDRWNTVYSDGWKFDIDHLDAMCTQNTHMIIINTPHNPTGFMFTKEEFDRVVGIAKKNDCILFCDEMYRFLEFDKSHRLPSACEVYDNAISLCGLSKSFAMPGLRSGWLISKNLSFMDMFKTYKDYTTICASAPSEVLSIMALQKMDEIIERNLTIINKNLNMLDSFGQKYSSIIEYQRPKAGSICMPVLSDDINIDVLAKNLIDEKNLMILPSTVYNIETNGFRLGFGRTGFIDSLNILDEYMERLLA